MPQQFSPDCERFRAQLQHFIYVYGFSAARLGVALTHDPTRVYYYLDGRRLPTLATRQRFRKFMRDYRKSVMV